MPRCDLQTVTPKTFLKETHFAKLNLEELSCF